MLARAELRKQGKFKDTSPHGPQEESGQGAVQTERWRRPLWLACLRQPGRQPPVTAGLKTMGTDKSMVVQLQSRLHFLSPYMAIKALWGPNMVLEGRH